MIVHIDGKAHMMCEGCWARTLATDATSHATHHMCAECAANPEKAAVAASWVRSQEGV